MRAHSARLFLCCALLWFAAAPLQNAAAKAFEGEWATWFCPQGASPGADKCARFALALFQNGEALGGSYASATAGGAWQYAGSAPVILGNVTHLTANTLVTVGRAQQRMRVAMNVYNSRLRAQRIDQMPGGVDAHIRADQGCFQFLIKGFIQLAAHAKQPRDPGAEGLASFGQPYLEP